MNKAFNHNKKILLFQRIIPSYRVPVFRYLYQQLGIIVCHSKEGRKGKIKSNTNDIDFPTELLKRFYYQNDETAVIQNVFSPLFKYRPNIVITQFSMKYLTFWLLLFLRPIFRYKLVVWTHGIKNEEKNNPFKSFRGKLSLWVYKHSDTIILYSNETKSYFDINIKIKTPIFVAQNSLDTINYKKLFEHFEIIGKNKIKRELGFTKKYNIVYIGRLTKSKRIDLLLESFAILSRRMDVSLHIVGDGEERNRVEEYQTKNPLIISYGAVYNDELSGKILYCSDLLLIPGAVGLSIIHAFSFATPIITCLTSEGDPFHGPEIEYLIDGENGLFCALSANEIAYKIEYLLIDSDKVKKMSECALKTVYEDCTIENMCNGFKKAIENFN